MLNYVTGREADKPNVFWITERSASSSCCFVSLVLRSRSRTHHLPSFASLPDGRYESAAAFATHAKAEALGELAGKGLIGG